ncbi:YopX family protein [Aneurinibacillus terranovensis]|uniref:YopX family protein n=1 Tax=Aneurinibacillus terranovensis TaxID=278991 RepID=UPI000685BC81|nr:YopX family protein [Aneurinibacillus terranovensis]
MREIKYQAWLHDEKKMVNVAAINLFDRFIQYYDTTNCKDDAEIFELLREPPNADCPFERCELMQYTGLKDRNGKLIYEGDLCQKDNVLYEVRWVENCAKFGVKVIKSDSVLIRGCTFPIQQYLKDGSLECVLEVIGNIYENLEMLEVEK